MGKKKNTGVGCHFLLWLVCETSAIVWYFEHSLALPFFGIATKTDFSSPVATTEFSKFVGILSTTLS